MVLPPRLWAVLGWLGWAGAWAWLLGLPSVPPHSATDHRLLLSPLLLVPMLAPERWARLAMASTAGLVLIGSLQSLWQRTELWLSALIWITALAALVGTERLTQGQRSRWVLPVLGIGVGLLIGVNHSVRLGTEAAVIGGVSLLTRGHPALERGGLVALLGVILAAWAYAEAAPSLPLIGCSVLALGILHKQATWVQLVGVIGPLAIGCLPGAIALKSAPF